MQQQVGLMACRIMGVNWPFGLANVQCEQLCAMTVLARVTGTYYAATYRPLNLFSY